MSLTPFWKQPSHPGLIEVVGSDKPFGSYAISLVSLPAGAHFANITNHSFVDDRTYASVQVSSDRNIDLNSDLLYINHSCDPALEMDMSRFEVRVSRSRALTKGDLLTFFYPSTEYQMAQAFDCHCNTPRCKGRIVGAELMALNNDLQGYWLNEHIEHLLKENEKGGGEDDRQRERQRAKRTMTNGTAAT
ncbi:hypothetical protein MMC22_009384 [Lobaria immixta]|nr:hypothetical protein [Lobaria immixta]